MQTPLPEILALAREHQAEQEAFSGFVERLSELLTRWEIPSGGRRVALADYLDQRTAAGGTAADEQPVVDALTRQILEALGYRDGDLPTTRRLPTVRPPDFTVRVEEFLGLVAGVSGGGQVHVGTRLRAPGSARERRKSLRSSSSAAMSWRARCMAAPGSSATAGGLKPGNSAPRERPGWSRSTSMGSRGPLWRGTASANGVRSEPSGRGFPASRSLTPASSPTVRSPPLLSAPKGSIGSSRPSPGAAAPRTWRPSCSPATSGSGAIRPTMCGRCRRALSRPFAA